MANELNPLSGQPIAEQNEHLLFALYAAEIGTWDLNIAKQQVWWDDRCKQLYGFQEDDVVPYEQVLQYMHPDDAGRVDQAVQWALNPQSGGQYDVQFRTLGAKDGQERWLHCRGKAFFNDQHVAYRFSGTAQDITQLMQARHQLGRSEAQLTDLVMATPAATAVFTGRTMRIQQVNAPMLAIWGKDGSVVGKTLHEAIPELDGQPFLAQLQHVFDTGEPFRETESRADLIENGQRKTVWFNHAYNPLHNQNGQIYGVINTAIDVTAQVIARQQLAEREAQLNSIIQQTPTPTLVLRGDEYRIDRINQAMLAFMGRGEEVIGQPLLAIMPELDGQFAWQQVQRAYREGIHFDQPEVLVPHRRNGVMEDIYYNVSYRPLWEGGRITGMIQVATDVTEQLTARRALKESQAILQQAIDLAELGTFSVDVTTNLLTASPRVVDWFGFDSLTADASAFIAGVGEHERDYVQTSLYNTLLPGSDGRYDVVHSVINAKTGHQRILHALGRVYFDAAGQPVKIEGTAQDITSERKVQLVLERQVQQRTEELGTSNRELAANNEELAEANSLLRRSNENLQQFAYIASHDLQEPLRKIQSFGDLLKIRYAADAASEEFAYLDRMQTAASRMSTLIRDLLSFSRISTQRNTDTPVLLGQVVEGALSVLDMVIAETQAQVTVDALPSLSGDAVQLGQLFQNLLSNALKFRRPDVPPRIHVSSQTLTAAALPNRVRPNRRTDVYVRIDVTDNGIGFDEKYLDRIFQVFQRLHGRNEYSGTGIGLAICEKVVTNHGGSLTAASRPGQGSTFSVYLPA